jgi:hypothetical protein
VGYNIPSADRVIIINSISPDDWVIVAVVEHKLTVNINFVTNYKPPTIIIVVY